MAGSRRAPKTAVLSLELEVYNETMTITKLGSYIVAGMLSMAFAVAQSPKPARTPDVPYVPTTDKAVEAMLKLADVKKSDIVYDLGCGDGRIVIAAAKIFGARGVGIDINPVRIGEAKENAKKAGVEKLVRFEENDLFVADYQRGHRRHAVPASERKSEAASQIAAGAKPGTRVVSNTFDMGDWKPEKEAHVGESEGEDFSGLSQRLFLWTIPARK